MVYFYLEKSYQLSFCISVDNFLKDNDYCGRDHMVIRYTSTSLLIELSLITVSGQLNTTLYDHSSSCQCQYFGGTCVLLVL